MGSEKLRKYLAYYQKVLKGDPENIEARLRLAAIFREMGRTQHAVEEYVTASKLLAKEALPLEAIAACKAVLELDPGHSEIQFFLARLYAQVPEATGNTSRIAQPLNDAPVRPESGANAAVDPGKPITLDRPKPSDPDETQTADAVAREAWAHEKPTTTALVAELSDSLEEPTSPLDEDSEPHELDNTSPLSHEDVPRFEDPADRMSTTEIAPVEVERRPETLFATQDLSEEDILESRPLDEVSAPVTIEFDSIPTRAGELVPDGVPEVTRPGLSSDELETFEVGVFDMESLRLDDEGSDPNYSFLEDLEIESPELHPADASDSRPAILSVSRADLPEIPLFSKLNASVFMELLRAIDLQTVPAGTPIVQPNVGTRTLYVIVRGTTQVTRIIDGQEVELATMGEGEFFGEFRLLTGRDGSATVRAASDVELLAISEEVINRIADKSPEIWDVLWDFYYARMLNNLLACSEMFRPLDRDERAALAEKFTMQEVVANEIFLRRGQPCEHLFLVLNGEVRVERDLGGVTEHVATMREGEFFGVVSSLGGEPYTADVRAARDTTLLCLPAQEFRRVTETNADVAQKVQRVIRSRRYLNDAFTSGITLYAELGIAKVD